MPDRRSFVFPMWTGVRFLPWLRLLARHRFRVAPSRLPRAAAITAAVKKGFAPASNDALLAELTSVVKADKSPRCVVFFSNGAFGGIIPKFARAC